MSSTSEVLHKKQPLIPRGPGSLYSQRLFVNIGIAALLFFMLGWMLVSIAGDVGEKEIKGELSLGLTGTSSVLSQVLSKPLILAKLAAGSEIVRTAVDLGDDRGAWEKVNALLDRYKETSGALRIAVFSDDGILKAVDKGVITYVGEDFSFRPYVKKSLTGTESQYFAYGATDNLRGYYTSVPVYDEGGHTVGVVMTKFILDEQILHMDPYKHMYLVSPEGVILLSSNQDWLLKSIYPLSPQKRKELAETRQFGDHEIEQVSLQWNKEDNTVSFKNRTFIYEEVPVTDDGWKLLMLHDDNTILQYRFLMAGVVFFLFLISSGVILYIFKERQIANVVTQYNVELEDTVAKRTRKLDNTIAELESEIKERRHAEESLRTSEERYHNLFSSIRDTIIVADADRTIVNANESALKKTFGYELRDVVGKNSKILYADIKDHVQSGKEIFDKKEAVSDKIMEMNFKRKDGTVFTGELFGMKLLNSDGEPTGNIGIIRDITDQKKMEEELQKRQKLEAAGVLAGGIAHDFNNLLTSMLNNIYLAKMHLDPGHKSYERLEQAGKALMSATNLTNQLLTFSKGGVPVRRTVSLFKIIKDAANFALSGSNVKSRLELAEDLWLVEADEGQIMQVLQNLILNADQSMPEGGILSVTAENIFAKAETGLPLQEGPYVKLTVTDQGIGIAQENLQKIFDPYFTTKDRGNGLGLAVSYSIVKNHYGHISVDSQVGEGTSMTVYLPASAKQVADTETYLDEIIPGKGRILIMDDEEMVRVSLGEMLTKLGYTVDLTIDGDEAVKKYKEAMDSSNPHDLVIVDLTIPGGMGGKEAVRKLLEVDPQVKVVVSSGYSNDPIMAHYKEYGFRDVLLKPYTPDKLSSLLHNILKKNEA